MRQLSVLRLLFASGLIFISSCAIQTGLVTDFQNKVIDEKQTAFKGARIWVRSFAHKQIGSVTTMYASGAGGSASGLAVGRNIIESPTQDIIAIIRNSGIFESVTPLETDTSYNLILEGSIDTKWKMPWWNYPQLIDIWIHAWIFPTLGRHLICKAEINIYDKKYNPVYSASVNYTKKYVGHLWWMITHGGNYDLGSDVEAQKEVLEYTFAQIKNEMGLAINEYFENNASAQNE